MKDPSKSPGFQFQSIRVTELRYDLPIKDRAPTQEKQEGRLAIKYDEDIEIDGTSILVRQEVTVQVVDVNDDTQVYVRAFVRLEGRFEAGEDANLEVEEFANNYAPAILFPFSREWIHRITSASGPWPAILIPPMNVLQARKRTSDSASTSDD